MNGKTPMSSDQERLYWKWRISVAGWGGDFTPDEKARILRIENEIFQLEDEEFRNWMIEAEFIETIISNLVATGHTPETAAIEIEEMLPFFEGYNLKQKLIHDFQKVFEL